jgi:hypothetical protein
MKTIFYIIASVLVISWAVGVFVFGAGMFIHCVLVMALLSFLHGVICNPRCYKKDETIKFKTLDMQNG